MSQIDLLLVNPSNKKQMYGELGTSLVGIEPPIWIGLLAGFIRKKGFTVKIIDADAEGWTPEYTAERIVECAPLLLGIGAIGANPSASSTPKMAAASKILHILKDRNIGYKTFLYGIHPSALPERTLIEEPVDFVCRGEAFYPVFYLLTVLKSGSRKLDYDVKGLWYCKGDTIVSNGWADVVKNLDELPFAAWDLLPMDKYRAHNWHCFGHIKERKPYAIIYTSLGCPFNCTYCNVRALYNGKPGIRFRSIQKVVEEIDFLVKNYKIKNLKILDELFVFKENRVIEFCDLIIKGGYDLNIWVYARIDTVNEKILRKMKQAGINWLCYGIESGSKKVRDGVTKGQFNQDAVKKAIKMTYNAGIYIMGNFMFGLPDDNIETMQETLNMAKEINCEYVNFYTTMAYPGSQLYKDVLNNGTPLPENWLGYSQFAYETVPLPTKHLSSADVLRFRDRAFIDYYTNPRYLEMIEKKFGKESVIHIQQMLKHKIQRKLLESEQAAVI